MGNYCCGEKQNTLIKPKRLSKNISSTTYTEKSVQNQTTLLFKQKLINNQLHQLIHVKLTSKIGAGAQSMVYIVNVTSKNLLNTNQKMEQLAMKQIQKSKLVTQQALMGILLQHKIMTQFKSPFINKLIYSYEDQKNIYFFMKIAKGGDLYSFANRTTAKGQLFRRLNGQGLRFVIAGVILGLQQLRKNNIVYRDLKAENILIDENGYPMLTDFGLSIEQKCGSKEMVKGSNPYIAPQMVGQNFDYGIDLWSLGILIYYIIYNEFPFAHEDIFSKDYPQLCKINEEKYIKDGVIVKDPYGIIANSLDMVNKLLKVQKDQRLGFKNIAELKSHSLFKGFSWKLYQNQRLQSPLKWIIDKHALQLQQIQQISQTSRISVISEYPVQWFYKDFLKGPTIRLISQHQQNQLH